MRPRHPKQLPKTWLMTDERMSEGLWKALARLPRGSGVVFRHYATPVAERAALFARVRAITRRRRLVLVVPRQQRLRGDGVHGRNSKHPAKGLLTRPAHSRREAIAAQRVGADLIFVSPVFTTRSHPGARVLGPVRLGMMIRGLTTPVIALGGMNARRFRGLSHLKLHGWAAIDAWMD